MLKSLLRDKELAPAVEVENVVEILLGNIFLLAPDFGARVGDDEVQSSEVGDGFVEELDDFCGFGNIGLEGDGFAAEFEDFLDDGLSRG